jgi:hypothetical protein
VLGVVVPVDVLAGRSLHSDRVADLNERSTRRGTPGGQSGEAITGRKLRAIPGAPGCPARYEHAETIKKIGKSDPLAFRRVPAIVATRGCDGCGS